MIIEINKKEYEIVIEYKNIKNMYLRIKPDLKILVSAPKNINKKSILNFINNNMNFIEKSIAQKEEILNKNKNKLLYLGNYYDICYSNDKTIFLGTNKAFINKNTNINNWYKKQAKTVFEETYNKCFNNFKEYGTKPDLKIRKMTSKWGVCNVTDKVITLNLDLIKLDIKYLEYVIYHELSHLIYPNHSSNFWDLVSKYIPEYKKYRKEMKNII